MTQVLTSLMEKKEILNQRKLVKDYKARMIQWLEMKVEKCIDHSHSVVCRNIRQDSSIHN